MVHCSADVHTLVAVNLTPHRETVTLDPVKFGLSRNRALFDNIGGRVAAAVPGDSVSLELGPFGRIWLTDEKIDIAVELLVPLAWS